MKVLSFVNQKGGVGKTTMTYLMAHKLHDQGHKVLVIDADPQGNLSYSANRNDDTKSFLNLKSQLRVNTTEILQQFGLYELLVNSVKELKSLHLKNIQLAEVLIKKQSFPRLWFLAPGLSLSSLDVTLAAINFPRVLVMKHWIQNEFQKEFMLQYPYLGGLDYILIDAPPTLGLLFINILFASDELWIPFKCDEFSLWGLKRMLEVLDDLLEMNCASTPKVRAFIPNLTEGRRKEDRIHLEHIIKLTNSSSFLRHKHPEFQIFEPCKNQVKISRIFKDDTQLAQLLGEKHPMSQIQNSI
jgi:chromosome partitioning protein